MNYYCGIDLGGTGIKAGIVGEDYHIYAAASAPTPKGVDGKTLAAVIARVAEEAAGKMNLTVADTAGVGMGTPGYIDPERGINHFSNNLNLSEDPMAQNLSDCLGGKPVRIGNDANVAAYAEYLAGAARGSRRAVMVTLGTGIGVGVIIHGSDHGMAAEGGHMIIRHGGRHCSCGHDGCFEAYASASALVAQAREAMAVHPETMLWKLCGGDLWKVDGKMVFDGRDAGDPVANQVVDQYIEYLGFGLSNFINLLEPDMMVIGGGICAQGDKLLIPLRRRVREMVYHPLFADRCRMAVAELGNDAGIIGAAGLGGLPPAAAPSR